MYVEINGTKYTVKSRIALKASLEVTIADATSIDNLVEIFKGQTSLAIVGDKTEEFNDLAFVSAMYVNGTCVIAYRIANAVEKKVNEVATKIKEVAADLTSTKEEVDTKPSAEDLAAVVSELEAIGDSVLELVEIVTPSAEEE